MNRWIYSLIFKIKNYKDQRLNLFIWIQLLVLGILLFARPAQADINHIRSGSTIATFQTIQACANVAVAGDICLVNPGTYNEVVIPANSGSAGNLITFRANGAVTVNAFRLSSRTFIRIDGFELTYLPGSPALVAAVYLSGSHGAEILNNHIHHNDGIGIWLHHGVMSNNVVIRGNRIHHTDCIPGSYIGSQGVLVNGDHVLVENNDISHVGDFLNGWGHRMVVRNNYFHDVYNEDFPEYFLQPNHDPLGHHVDAFQHFQAPNPLHFLLFENNIIRDVPLYNVHGGIFQDQDGVASDSDVIYRYNTFYHLGGEMLYINPFRDLRVYNNSSVDLCLYGQRGNTSFPIDGMPTGGANSTNIKIRNNIFYNTTRQVSWARPYDVADTALVGFEADFNLISLSGNLDVPEVNGLFNVAPDFVNYQGGDLALQSNSAAVDRAGPLTHVASADTGAGTPLVVNDAHYFQDGWAGVNPDWVAVGSPENTAQVVSINYQTNVITLSNSLPRTDGDPVWLFRDSMGRQVLYGNRTDIGAYEYSGPPVPTAPRITVQPQNQSVVVGQSATFSIQASGTQPFEYQWERNGAVIEGATLASVTTPTTALADSGSVYRCVVTNEVGSVTSDEATLTVTEQAILPTISTQPESQTVAAGQPVTFSVEAQGTSPMNYQWRRNGSNISGATGAIYTILAVWLTDNGARFSCRITNTAGVATSDEATLTVTQTGGAGEGPVEARFLPFRNVFNPTKETLTILYQGSGELSLVVYDRSGSEVKVLDRGANGQTSWDGRNDKGSIVASGNYVVILKQRDKILKKKVVVVK